MNQTVDDPNALASLYRRRFDRMTAYRQRVWEVLTGDFFQRLVSPDATVLDLGCGYGEFINNIAARKKYAMDLNPNTPQYLSAGVTHILGDCSERWPFDDGALDVVFSSNFFEHLPDKATLRRTFGEAARCIRPGGRLIAMGPNVKYVPGQYWDFFDHYLPLTELSLGEGLETSGFRVVSSIPRFLPYSMSNGPRFPLVFLKLYLRLRFAWPLFGKQFLVVAERVQAAPAV